MDPKNTLTAGIFVGPSHKQGGIKCNDGQYELEGGEAYIERDFAMLTPKKHQYEGTPAQIFDEILAEQNVKKIQITEEICTLSEGYVICKAAMQSDCELKMTHNGTGDRGLNYRELLGAINQDFGCADFGKYGFAIYKKGGRAGGTNGCPKKEMDLTEGKTEYFKKGKITSIGKPTVKIPEHREKEVNYLVGNRFEVAQIYEGIKSGEVPYEVVNVDTFNPKDKHIRIFEDVLKENEGKKIDNENPTGLWVAFNYKGDNTMFPIDGNHRMFKLHEAGEKSTKIIIVSDIKAVKKHLSDAIIDKNEIKEWVKEIEHGGTIDVPNRPKPSQDKDILNNEYQVNKEIESLIDNKGETPDNYTADEKQLLRQYSGYGGIKSEFLTVEQAKGSFSEFYTPDAIIRKMWGLAYKYGFQNGGSILEPSVGTGAFLKYVPKGSEAHGYEINKYSYTISKIFYPQFQFHLQPFEQIFIKNRDSIKNSTDDLPKYDLVIGNPPYGNVGGIYMRMGEKKHTHAQNYIEYFILRGLDLCKPTALLIYIIGTEVQNGGIPFLQQGKSKTKEMIAERSELIDAYRLPNGAFERTDVLTDIIVLKKK